MCYGYIKAIKKLKWIIDSRFNSLEQQLSSFGFVSSSYCITDGRARECLFLINVHTSIQLLQFWFFIYCLFSLSSRYFLQAEKKRTICQYVFLSVLYLFFMNSTGRLAHAIVYNFLGNIHTFLLILLVILTKKTKSNSKYLKR